MIEPLKAEDVEKATLACIEYAQEINEPYDEDYIRGSLLRLSDKIPILVAKNDEGEIIGMSAFVCVPHLYDPNVMLARECIWHTSPKLNNFARARLQRKLLDQMMMVCRKKGISLYINVRHDSSMGDMLEIQGFKKKTIQYVKEAE
jgi:hypothetical protein